MNIKCSDCGHENQLGAIFCRNCGSKLDLEAMRPTVRDRKIGGGITGLLRRVSLLISLLMVACLLIAIFLPFGLSMYQPPSDDVAKSAKTKFDALDKRLDGAFGPGKHAFSPAEVTAAFNSEVLPTALQSENASCRVEHVMFDAGANGETVIDLDVKLFGKVPLRFSIVGRPVVSDSAGADSAPVLNFEIISASLGHLPMPVAQLKSKIGEKVQALAQLAFPDKLLKALKAVEVDAEGNFVFILASPKQAAPARK